jgi:hypothetical protein
MSGGVVVPGAHELVAELERALRGDRRPPPRGIAALACELLSSNVRQWDLEDLTHDPATTDSELAAAKRAIDRLNLARHDLVEQIDAAVATALDQSPTAALATETPGMVVDRLSVLVIRITRTTAAASVGDGTSDYADRLPMLRAQLGALTSAFDVYLDELRVGRRRFLCYEQFKLYGADPPADRPDPTSAAGSHPG